MKVLDVSRVDSFEVDRDGVTVSLYVNPQVF